MRDWKSKIYNQGMLLKYQAADFCIITKKVLESFGIIPSTQSCISPPTLCLLNDCALIKVKPASSLGKGMGPVSLVVILQKLICDGSQEGYGIQARRYWCMFWANLGKISSKNQGASSRTDGENRTF